MSPSAADNMPNCRKRRPGTEIPVSAFGEIRRKPALAATFAQLALMYAS